MCLLSDKEIFAILDRLQFGQVAMLQNYEGEDKSPRRLTPHFRKLVDALRASTNLEPNLELQKRHDK